LGQDAKDVACEGEWAASMRRQTLIADPDPIFCG
jgi:hypothetical protein